MHKTFQSNPVKMLYNRVNIVQIVENILHLMGVKYGLHAYSEFHIIMQIT